MLLIAFSTSVNYFCSRSNCLCARNTFIGGTYLFICLVLLLDYIDLYVRQNFQKALRNFTHYQEELHCFHEG